MPKKKIALKKCSLQHGVKCYPKCLLESIKYLLLNDDDDVHPGCFVCGKIQVIIKRVEV